MQMQTSLNEDEVFGQQIVSIMKRLEPAKKSTARIQVLQLLDEIEFSMHTQFSYSHQHNF